MNARMDLKFLFTSQKFLLLGFCLGIFYWIFESWLHAGIFQEGPFLAQVVSPTPHELWKRLLVVSLLMTFGIYAQHAINTRRRTEEILKEKKDELTLILENNPAAILLIDVESRKINWANSNALKLLKATREKIVGCICHSHICPNEKNNCPILDGKQSADLSEKLLLSGDGTKIPILKSVTQVNYNGREHLLEAFFDLTTQKNMKKDLVLAHAEMDRIFQTASVGMRIIDQEFNVLKINKTFELITGVDIASAAGKKCYEVFSGPMCFTGDCPMALILHGKKLVECEVDKKRVDGKMIPCILTASPFTGPAGEILGIVESFQDITDLKIAQRAIRLERDKLQGILSSIIEGVGIINATNYSLEYMNGNMKKYLGSDEGVACHQAIYQRDEPCRPCRMLTALNSGVRQESNYNSADGKNFEISYTPIVGDGGEQKVIILLRDISEKIESMKAMMRAEQLSALGELAAGVAHEINNPINGIINYAQIIFNNSDQGSQNLDISTRILMEGERIAWIIDGLLSFAKRREEKKTYMSVDHSISNSLKLVDSHLRKEKIILQLETEENIPPIYAQPYEIEQVFINLISNARYALNKKYQEADYNKILKINTGVLTAEAGRVVRISFCDHGCGIPKETLPKVINPFFTTKSDRKSTGLGLSISHGIIENLNGRLTICSKENEYTEVRIDIPLP